MAARKCRYRFLPAMLLISILLNSCSRESGSPTSAPLPTHRQNTPSQTSSPVFEITVTSTATPTSLPIVDEKVPTEDRGIIVFSMGDGGRHHLFAYHPNYLPISRLTTGEWDDRDPAISPDGNFMVFASNRSGQWDLYLWDLRSNTINQLTNSVDFEADPDWSPDNQWITYESYANGQSNIHIRSVFDASAAPIQLTEDTGNNLDPSWSPLGRQIAFSTNRSGKYEIWTAQLDSVDNRFSKLAGGNDFDYFNPSWSPDGLSIAWEKRNGYATIETINVTASSNNPFEVGVGTTPFWSPDGSTVLARYDTPDQNFLTGYNAQNGNLVYPMIGFAASTSPFQWVAGNSLENLKNIMAAIDFSENLPLCQSIQTIPTSENGRLSMVELKSVKIDNPFLSDMADECYSALRNKVEKIVGWDVLGNLNRAALPITASPDPGIPQNWLYTGRAVALSLAPFNSNWMAVSREDFEGQTYWYLWAKCVQQDGRCGIILTTPVWEFSSRASGDLQAFEDGGKLIPPPSGYWIDLTDIARQYGWYQLASLSNWRTYYPGIQFNLLAFTEGKSWEQAMRELYPEEAINLVRAGK